MRTPDFDPRSAHILREWPDCLMFEDSFRVSVSESVNADRPRIIQALTEPEYIETWFSPPGAVAGGTFVSSWENSLLFCWSNTDGAQSRVLCSYKLHRRSKLLLNWNPVAGSTDVPKLVKIQLRGDFERTIVHVTHTGLLRSRMHFYEDLWGTSLEKLGNLFSSSGSSTLKTTKTHVP